MRISPSKITIEANCENSEVLRLVNTECEGIKSILQDATYNWSVICPEELSACLPTFEPPRLLLRGKLIKKELINVQFKIQQKKAFNLLQGNNIYENNTFVFLREIFQNAIDASKMQYWIDWKGSRWYLKKENNILNINDIGQRLSPISYPVEVELHLAKKEKFSDCYDTMDGIEDVNGKCNPKMLYGVLVRVIDHGIGMTSSDIEAIADVGTSYEHRRDMIESMPEWLKPTAEFGIGLQSAFLASDSMVAYTHPRTNEKYRVDFQATGEKGMGHIGVTPLDDADDPHSYGTIFEIFVPIFKMKKHEEDIKSWSGIDPFSEGYKETHVLRHARELEVQLALYLDSLVGEKLFPIKLRMYDFNEEQGEVFYKKKLENNISHLDWMIILNKKRYSVAGNKGLTEIDDSKGIRYGNPDDEKDGVTWAYQLKKDNPNMIQGMLNYGFQYALDYKNMKLYLWNNSENVYARFGADRLQALRRRSKISDVSDTEYQTKIFYKGVYVRAFEWTEDANLLEYIDVKGKLQREYLAFNRGDFTKKGYDYIRKTIYPSVLAAAHEALEECDKRKEIFDCIEDQLNDMISDDDPGKSVFEREDDAVLAAQRADKIQKYVLSAVGLAALSQIQSVGTVLAPDGRKKCEQWNNLLAHLSKKINEQKSENRPWTQSIFFSLDVYEQDENPYQNSDLKLIKKKTEDIAHIMNSVHKYAIVSRRNTRNSSWEEYLVCLNPKAMEQSSSLSNEKKDEDKTPESIQELIGCLKMQWDEAERQETIDKIEKWGEDFIQYFKKSNIMKFGDGNEVRSMNQNLIINWMLDNMPTIALFSDRESSVRVNIMDSKYTDSMYININIKWNIYRRMLEMYRQNGIQRFSTVALTGYCQLALEENPASIFYVKRGKFARIGQRYSIIPFDGKMLEGLLDDIEKNSVYTKGSDLYNVYGFFIEFEDFLKETISSLIEKEKKGLLDTDPTNSVLWKSIKALGDGSQNKILQNVLIMFRDKLDQLEKNNKNISENIPSGNSYNESGDIWSDKQFREVLSWILDLENQTNSNCVDWIMYEIMPRYKHLRTEKKLDSGENKELLEKFENEKLFECGLEKQVVGTTVKNQSRWVMMQRLIKEVSEKSWLHISDKQVHKLYEMFVKEQIRDIIKIEMKQLEDVKSQKVLLSLLK